MKVIGSKHDFEGNPIGDMHANPILDTRVYNIKFSDGHVESDSAYFIIENINTQVETEGNCFALLSEIINL